MTTAAELLAQRRVVLLDFDGPVCAVFGAIADEVVADKLRDLLPRGLPREVAQTRDPFAVLRYAAMLNADIAAEVEADFHQQELRAVCQAQPTSGAFATIRALRANGHRLIIVSNNSKEAVRRFLLLHGISDEVSGISARSDANPEHLKPTPYLLHQAMRQLAATADQCVMVGDSTSDIEAAHAANMPVITYANKPGKRATFEPHGPDVIIESMTELLPGS